MYVYNMEPIDCWDGWTLVKDYKFGCGDLPEDERSPFLTKKEFEDLYLKAQKIAKAFYGWDGDVRTGPFISGIPAFPGDCSPQILIGWKQDNNGITFVASPVRLTWLDPDDTLEDHNYDNKQ
jgi:hypothetical protein